MTKEEYGRDENAAPAKDTTLSRVGDIVFSPVGTPREGTLICDGSAVSRQTYKELFDFLGVSCGEGDGSTTFNLPDLRDVWILCAGTEHEVGDAVAEGLPEIEGAIASSNIVTFATLNGTLAYGAYESITTQPGGILPQNQQDRQQINGWRFKASSANAIYGASQHVTPASVAVLPCIVYE